MKRQLVTSAILVFGLAIATGCTARRDMNKNTPGLAPTSSAFLPTKGGSPVPTEETSGAPLGVSDGTTSGMTTGSKNEFGSTREQTLHDTGSVPGSGGAGTSHDLRPIGTGDGK